MADRRRLRVALFGIGRAALVRQRIKINSEIRERESAGSGLRTVERRRSADSTGLAHGVDGRVPVAAQ
jgi:hypothetical protein